jgi:hypothetical protein
MNTANAIGALAGLALALVAAKAMTSFRPAPVEAPALE